MPNAGAAGYGIWIVRHQGEAFGAFGRVRPVQGGRDILTLAAEAAEGKFVGQRFTGLNVGARELKSIHPANKHRQSRDGRKQLNSIAQGQTDNTVIIRFHVNSPREVSATFLIETNFSQ